MLADACIVAATQASGTDGLSEADIKNEVLDG